MMEVSGHHGHKGQSAMLKVLFRNHDPRLKVPQKWKKRFVSKALERLKPYRIKDPHAARVLIETKN